jgi:hypothetical protein
MLSSSTKPVIFTFPLPPTMNEIIDEARKNKYESSKTKKKWTDDIAMLAHGGKIFPSKVWMNWIWHIENLDRDEDNIASARKFICDGLVQAGIIKDDSCRIIQTPVNHWHIHDVEDFVEVGISDRPDFVFEWMEVNREKVMGQI